MPKSSICSIPGCSKSAFARGWCNEHYHRWHRYGDPMAARLRAPFGEPERYFREVVLAWDSDDCLIWPFARDRKGYGKLKLGKGTRAVHVAVCEAVHGPRPTIDHQAAHKCGKGHLGCVAKRHLRWATPAENTADMYIHGTVTQGEKSGLAKLTDSEVLEIRALRGLLSQREIGERYGVSGPNVCAIQGRRSWKHLP